MQQYPYMNHPQSKLLQSFRFKENTEKRRL